MCISTGSEDETADRNRQAVLWAAGRSMGAIARALGQAKAAGTISDNIVPEGQIDNRA